MDKKSNIEIFIDFIKAIVWPAFAFTLLIGFWSPITNTLNKIPTIIDRSESITIAGLSLKIEKGIKVKPTDDVKEVLSLLSADGVKQLMNQKHTSYYDNKNWPKIDNEELFSLKLMEEISEKNLGDHKYGMRPTLLGTKCQKFLDAVMVQIVKEIAQ